MPINRRFRQGPVGSSNKQRVIQGPTGTGPAIPSSGLGPNTLPQLFPTGEKKSAPNSVVSAEPNATDSFLQGVNGSFDRFGAGGGLPGLGGAGAAAPAGAMAGQGVGPLAAGNAGAATAATGAGAGAGAGKAGAGGGAAAAGGAEGIAALLKFLPLAFGV